LEAPLKMYRTVRNQYMRGMLALHGRHMDVCLLELEMEFLLAPRFSSVWLHEFTVSAVKSEREITLQ
jgi:hypothetical protein